MIEIFLLRTKKLPISKALKSMEFMQHWAERSHSLRCRQLRKIFFITDIQFFRVEKP